MHFQVDYPEKYTLCPEGITFDGNGDLDTSSGGWTGPTELSKPGMYSYSADFDWDTIVNGGSALTGQRIGSMFQYTIPMKACFVETFDVLLETNDQKSGRRELHDHTWVSFDRQLHLRFPLNVQLNAFQTLSTTFETHVVEMLLFDVIDQLTIANVDLVSNARVDVAFTTTVNWPWSLSANNYALDDPQQIIQPGTTPSLTLIGEDCNGSMLGDNCIQDWEFVLTSTEKCGTSGDLALAFTSSYRGITQQGSVPMTLHIQPTATFDCGVTIGNADLSGTMLAHDEVDKFTNTPSSAGLYLSHTSYMRSTFTSVATITSITMKGFSLTQNSNVLCSDCQSNPDYEYLVDSFGAVGSGASENFFHWSFKLYGGTMVGSTHGINLGISASFEVTFATGRRQLLEIEGEGVNLITRVRIKDFACHEPNGDIGDVSEGKSSCKLGVSYVQCKRNEGWTQIYNPCEHKESEEVLQTVDTLEEPKSWFYGSLTVVFLIFLLSLSYYFHTRRRSTIVKEVKEGFVDEHPIQTRI